MYNKVVIDLSYDDLLEVYINKVKSLLNDNMFEESFYIMKAIIEVSNDTKCICECDDLIDYFPIIGMNLRIIYRKGSKDIKLLIDDWIEQLESNNFYESIYLEDIILGIKCVI